MRFQLALNAPDIDQAIEFYSKLFGAEPDKVKPGYANWALDNPPLKFIVFEDKDAVPGSVNHLGVETEHADEVVSEERRLRESGLTTTGIDETICCFAEKVETWVHDPHGQRWEWYVKQGDSETQRENLIVRSLPVEDGADAGKCCG